MKEMTVAAAAEALGISRVQVSRLLLAGRIKGQKFGPVWRVNAASVEDYADSERRPGPKRPRSRTPQKVAS